MNSAKLTPDSRLLQRGTAHPAVRPRAAAKMENKKNMLYTFVKFTNIEIFIPATKWHSWNRYVREQKREQAGIKI